MRESNQQHFISLMLGESSGLQADDSATNEDRAFAPEETGRASASNPYEENA
jgi:hypothetical protein